MKVLEIFSGTASFSGVCKRYGYETFTIDIDKGFHPDLVQDILTLQPDMIPFDPDIIWASPPCTHFSVATIGRNWNKDYTPKSDGARYSLMLISKMIGLIDKMDPRYIFIENPRAMLRKIPMMQIFKRHTITYCQYGHHCMKPTDIFSNISLRLKAPCKNGDPCHERASRGSKTGTQGLKDNIERGKIPPLLCEDILKNIT